MRAAKTGKFRWDFVAINHWPLAIQTHMKNHPWARHMCASLVPVETQQTKGGIFANGVEAVDPNVAVPGGKLDVLLAAPSCVHHSVARGGKPREAQSRAQPWCIVRWADALHPEGILVENVREIMSWGPLDDKGQIVKERKGEYFREWLQAFDNLGYRVEYKVLCAANYGDPTTRERFFLQARRKRHKIQWPDSTHSKAGADGLPKWRSAREIIDWSLPGQSIFNRKKPLCLKTIQRIAAGLERFGGEWAKPFLCILYGTNKVRDIERPLPTVTAGGQHIALCQSFLLGQQSGSAPRSVDDPVPTIATAGAISLVQPFILPAEGYFRGNAPRSIDDPMPTVVASKETGYLVEPFLCTVSHGDDSKSAKPENRCHSVNAPLPVVTSHSDQALIQPFVMQTSHTKSTGRGKYVWGTDEPLRTITSGSEYALVKPYLVKYFKTGIAKPVSDPLDTVTTKPRFGLVEPLVVQLPNGDIVFLDIRFRMLQPRELAAAMSFPPEYELAGTKEEVVKQIGNAVPTRTACELVKALMA
jgi:DNA (cytosine-5)-methyltransferase 1